MNKPSKLLLTQAAAAIPASFSATTYQINQTLTVTPASNIDFQDDNTVMDLSLLMFDSGTGSFKAGTYFSTGPEPDATGYDISIALMRVHGENTGIKSTSVKAWGSIKSGTGTKALVNASNTQINDDPLREDGTNGTPIMTSFLPGTFPEMKALVREDTGYLGVRPSLYGMVGYKIANNPNSANEYPNDHNTNGTKYLGFTTGDGIDLYATINFDYDADNLTESVEIVSFRVADDADEQLLQYSEFVPVPESKQTAAVIALLAGSAALYRKRRKVA
jgi:hypothetical protein